MSETTLADRLAALVAPLEEERGRLSGELEKLDEQRSHVRDDLAKVEQILRRVNGGPPQKPGPKPGRTRAEFQRPSPESMDMVRKLIESEGFPREEFSQIRVQEIATGISKDTVGRCVLTMHQDGELRLLSRRGRSGARLYKYLGGGA